MSGKRPHRKKRIPMILSVVPAQGHRLRIEFGSRNFLDLNMQSHMRTNRYYDLSDPAIFYAAVTDGSKIIFAPNTVLIPDIFPREAVNMALRMPVDGMAFLRVQPMENSHIRIEMATGSVLILNMKNHLRTDRYAALQDEELFRSVRAEGEILVFGDLQIKEEELVHLMLSIPDLEAEEGMEAYTAQTGSCLQQIGGGEYNGG